ncbi:MAG: hypothetical protein KDA25_02715 [Phycisphaerales bacterium]|nr:hypothetical protein [Phycisphaerales bacterium]
MVTGTLLTIGAGELVKRSWLESGTMFSPTGGRDWTSVDLPEGSMTVYYQSPHGVPDGQVSLTIRYPDGELVPASSNRRPIATESEQIDFHIAGFSGRAISNLIVDVPGTYRFFCSNTSVGSDTMVAQDRVVFMKHPDRLVDMLGLHKRVLVIGASITVAIAALLYGVHGIVLSRRSRSGAGA